MSFSNRFLTGTAICLLMAAPSAYAATPNDRNMYDAPRPMMLAQADAPAPAAECPPGSTATADGCVAAEEPAAPPEEAAPPAEEPAPAPESAPAPEPAPEPEPEPAPAPEPEAPAVEEPDEPAAPEIAPPPPAEEPAVEQPAEEEPAVEEPTDEAPAAEEAPAEAAPADAAPAEEPAPEEPAPEEPAVDEEPAAAPDAAPADAAPEAEGEAPAEAAPADEAAPPTEETPAGETPAVEPGAETETPAEGAAPDATIPDVAPAEGETAPDATAPEAAPVEGEASQDGAQPPEGLPENAAPILDSQKEAAPDGAPAEGQPTQAEQPAAPAPGTPAQQQAAPAPLPESDTEAQRLDIEPEQFREEIRAIVQEEGRRIELGQTPQDRAMRRAEFYQRPDNVRVIQEFDDDRAIVQFGDRTYLRSNDYDRFVRQNDTVYFEELRNGRVREVVERSDGSRVVTVRNRYGDVVRRVRVLPDGQEYVMVYVPEDRYASMEPFRDPGRDLPPLRLTIPVEEYILDADRVQDPQAYYTFLAEPPVEPVERLYSLDEVRYSARIRDKVRRIDLDTIEFDFGSATISESEVGNLEALANAMTEMLEQNPGETFLLEGHTDAVGSDNANLALSDRRAEAVAVALTNVFGIPPETLVTQGYGEQYLKVSTQERERENRRVAVRRITPLVTPVASR